FSMPIGIHHLFADPQVGAGFKFVHAVMTAMVSIPTLLTVFTIVASAEIVGRLRGGKGPFGWVRALPWSNPMMLAVTFAFIMLGFGGAGGLINMSYQLNESIHNTQWVTGHFHLIFGGAIVIMYFMVAYALWPQLRNSAPLPVSLIRTQLTLWFAGMMILTLPWHLVGLLGAPRRMAYYDYTHPALQSQAITVTMSAFGGLLLVISAALFLYILASARRQAGEAAPFAFSVAVHPNARPPAVLNGLGLWVAMMVALTVVNYGYPIVQLALTPQAYVPVIPVGAR
ncbi:MAG: cbb3-type cytochrome c oxidase subunit I, partial [Pseudomonadota bacterium]|nr:cbb3-type cytochrome c oxidase subunit I [Pseudomonadota bacterium]